VSDHDDLWRTIRDIRQDVREVRSHLDHVEQDTANQLRELHRSIGHLTALVSGLADAIRPSRPGTVHPIRPEEDE
jgi:hypothetical protein